MVTEATSPRFSSRAYPPPGGVSRAAPLPTPDDLAPPFGIDAGGSTRPDPRLARRARHNAAAEQLGHALGQFRHDAPDANIPHLAVRDVLRRAWRFREVAGPVVGTFFGAFYLAAGLSVQAGFDLLQPMKAWPFNPHREQHRSLGAALVSTAAPMGIAFSILATTLVELAVRPLARLGHRRQRPASPLADQLWANITPLSPAARVHGACVLLCALAFGLAPGAITSVVGFEKLVDIPASPFNEEGVADRTAAAIWLGHGPTLGFFGLVLGVTVGTCLGRQARRLVGG